VIEEEPLHEGDWMAKMEYITQSIDSLNDLKKREDNAFKL
jgi:hypothetical protein